ncbi:MAG: cytochrome c biogenesis protein CcsA [Phycisphaerales bacterium]|nr:cytochrome c biogenesis protein CcsA [Phycisphaerales bacterium]
MKNRHEGIALLVALAIAVVSLVLPGPARAQTAPAGNEHPATEVVTRGAAQLANPFGEADPKAAARMSAEQKIAFSRAVDLSPLRDLAVFHNGRVKILDSLARETVHVITGRKDYQEVPIPGGSGVSGKHSFDPLFTFLDLTIDPGYYIERPLIGIDFLPLRRAFLEAAFPGDDAMQDRWLKLTRITPVMVMRHGDAIIEKHLSDEPYRRAISSLDRGLSLWQESKSNLEMIAPAAKDKPWAHLSTLPDDHPARRAALDLGAAWRAGDAAGVNRAAATLAAELPKINPGVYPTGRRSLELTYNRVNAFEWGYWAYAIALVTLLIAFGTGRRTLIAIGIATLAVALGLHAFGFITRCLIAERFAIQNQFESMTGLSLFGAAVGSVIMLAKRQWLFGAAAAGLGFLVLITATQTKIPGQYIEREAAILNTSVLLKYHVTTVLVSYGLITLGFIVSLFYLATYYFGKLTRPATASPAPARVAIAGMPGVKMELSAVDETAAVALGQSGGAASGGRARILRDLDTAQMTILQLAFWTLGVGILLGAWWADHSWGRWWAFDPKETWALITWIIYLIVVHVRLATGKNRDLITAWLSVAGFIVMLWTYFGVNLLLPGLHAYA